MCGIVGILGTKRAGITPEHYGAFFKAWERADQRGTDACGIIVATKEKLQWWKAPAISTDVSEYVQRKLFPWHEGINFVLGHTRAATDGDPNDNGNNHPIVIKNKQFNSTLLGIHNGMIWNKRELYDEYNMQPINEVDSEVAFRLIDHYGLQSLKPFKKLRGSFNLAYCSNQDTRSFFLVRHNNPLSLKRGKDYLAFGSMEWYWDKLRGHDEPFPDDTWAHILPEGEVKKNLPVFKYVSSYARNDNVRGGSLSYGRAMRYDPATGSWKYKDEDPAPQLPYEPGTDAESTEEIIKREIWPHDGEGNNHENH